jgi:sulfatase maturation enzyme AslB (radical SAM superfamily)
LGNSPISASTEIQKRRLQDNQELIKEEWRKKKDGATLSEKVAEHLEKIKKKEVVSHMIDTFFERIVENGNEYYVRFTDLQRDDRTIDVPDEFEIRAREAREAEEREAKRDIEFEEYK